MELELHPFEHSSTSDLFETHAEWHILPGNILHVRSSIKGPVHFLDFDKNPDGKVTAKDELWKKTCFEFFALKTNGTEYVEWNFSPSGDYQRYLFSSYRERVANAPAPTAKDAKISWKLTGESFESNVEVPLPFDIQKIQICWVAKLKTEPAMYWALSHTSSKPDFHNIDAFHQCGA